MACRFPGANDAERYWQNILQDVYSIAPMPAERFQADRYFDPEIGAYGKSYCRLGGLVDELPFDARAFRMTPKSVQSTDIAHLWALEVARATLQDAGYDPFELDGKNVGVVVGHARGSMMTADMAFGTAVEGLVQSLQDSPTLAALGVDRLAELQKDVVRRIHARYPRRTEDGAVGSMTSALAGLISNSFGLTGRHMVVDAACASSFAALEIGARALQQGKMDACIVGGASYSQELSVIMFAQSRALSPHGSFPFDERADGFISSDGFGLFLLRRLDDALRDGNQIRAVIRGVGGSCDGKGKALWAPRKEGQVLAMGRAYRESGVDPGTVSLIEGHATSTPLGDRTEVEAVHEVFAEARGGRPIYIGSVKGNIGHAREAAGAAGLTKAILALEQATLPPTGNFRNASEQIPWSEVAVQVSTSAQPWPEQPGPRRVGCNAFGIGGLNYHVLVEEAPPQRRIFTSASPDPAPHLEVTEAPLDRCDIAIVGVGAHYSGSHSADALFENLRSKADLTSRVADKRWSADVYHQPGERAPYRTYLDKGAFIDDFVPDWRRYKMPPKLVERNDPLQFMLLECAMDALQMAGLDPSAMDRERTAVTMGTVFGSDYALELSLAIRALEVAQVVQTSMGREGDEALLQDALLALRGRLPSINEDSSGSFSSSTLASRIAKTLDLMGPAYAVDAACASSMASVESACELLRDGVVDLAIAGGGDRAMRVQRYEAYCQFYALTKSGAPHPFDAEADGFLPGEGAGALVLERLEDARRNGHPIVAVIEGIGASANGDKKSLYASSAAGLSRAMQRAFTHAGIDPDTVGYVECHGGATPLGDKTEVEAVRQVYGPRREALTLGTIKSSVGHTQGAAGVASLIKAALILQRELLPPTRGFERAHPDHHFGDALRVNRTSEAYGYECAAVSSMGLAGINYHALLSKAAPARIETSMSDSHLETPSVVYSQPPRAPHSVVQVSAATAADVVTAFTEADPQALLTAGTTGEGPAVVCVAAQSADDVQRAQALLKKTGLSTSTRELREKQGLFVRTRATLGAERTALLFSGQGSQYPGMMAAFVQSSAAAQAVLEEVDAWCAHHAVPPLSARMTSGAPLPSSVFGVQSMILAADLTAHAALLESGFTPDVVTGHSYGDYAALVAAGAWSVTDALTATRLRCNAIEGAEVRGGMTSVTASETDLQAILQLLDKDTTVTVANRNAPDQIVLAGRRLDLAAAETRLAEAGLSHQRLEVPGPFHSPLMATARDLLSASLNTVELRAPKVPYLSSVTGRFEDDPQVIRRALVQQLLEPVDFVAQVERLLAEGVTVLVEAGPRAVLASLTRRIVGDADVVVLSTDDKARPGPWSIARVAAAQQARRTAGTAELLPAPAREGSFLSVLEGPKAESMMSEPGFSDFWEKTQPGVSALVERLWEDEKRSQRPQPASVARPRLTTPVPAPAPREAPAAPAPAAQGETRPEPLRPAPSPKAEALSVVPSPAAPAAARPSRDEVQDFLLEAICDESGYPPDIIEMDADLEADLGIDTVKQAQVFGKMRDKYALKADEKLALRDFPTMRHVLDYVDGQLSELASRPAVPSRIAVVDLTARRDARPTPPPPRRDHAPAPRPLATPRSPSSVNHGSAAPKAEDDSESDPSPGASEPGPPAVAKPGPGGLFELPDPQSLLPQRAALPVTVLHLRGTARQIGQQHGEAMKDPILEVMHRYQAFVGGAGMDLLALPETTRRLHGLFDRDTLDELQGIADAVGVSQLYLLAYNLDAALFPALTPGCTQALHLGRVNAGRLLHVVNEDSPLLLHLNGLCPRVVQVRLRSDAPIPNRRTVLFSMAGQVAGPNGVTADGLTVTGTTLLDAGPPPVLPDGLPHPQLVKQLLESATSLEHALELARSARRAGRWSLLISDADQDRGHYLEYDGPEILRDVAVKDRLTTTNHATSGAPAGHPAPEHSLLRETRACALLNGGEPIDAERAQSILRDRYDEARGRNVAHPTMNTVRRVDNVMSLVVEPHQRRLFVSDRVVPPGVNAEGEVRFIELYYGDRAGVVPMPEVMRRYVVRARTEALQEARSGDPERPEYALVVGTGPRAEHVTTQLRARGTRVLTVNDPTDALLALQRHPDLDALALVPAPPERPKIAELRRDAASEGASAWVLHDVAWADRREAMITSPFVLLRAWGAKGPVFAVTTLGGGLGFENAVQGVGEQGALLGALKAMRRELNITTLVLDTSPSEPPEQVALSLLAELERGASRCEVGLLRGQRMVLTMPERALTEQPSPAVLCPDSWIVTGGARGVTAKMAIRLAETSQPILHIFGRMPQTPEPEMAELRALDDEGLQAHKGTLLERMKTAPGFSPAKWKAACDGIDKALELDHNLRRMREAGSQAHYYAVDLSDRDAVRAALEAARARSDLQAILHGAGVEIAKPLDNKTDEIFEATIGGKVEGLVHLLHLTTEDPIRCVVGFSSVSGRFGGHGQVDYAMANEAMAHLLHEHRARHPERRVAAISWAAFSEVGLAARSSARTFLERTGQAFMTPQEGANHLMRELAAGLPEPEVTICERLEALDLDQLMVPQAERAAWLFAAARLRKSPMLGELIRYDAQETLLERRLEATEPFLADHLMGTTAILPAVLGLETFFELARGHSSEPVRLLEAEILTPLKIPEAGSVVVRPTLRARTLTLTACPRRPDGVLLEPDRVLIRGRFEPMAPVPPLVKPAPKVVETELLPYPYPDAPDPTPGSRMIFHGPTFRTLLGVKALGAAGVGLLKVPAPGDAFLGRPGEPLLPVGLFDGCLQAAGMLSRLLFEVIALPARFEDVVVLPEYQLEPGAQAVLHVEWITRVDDRIRSRLVLHGAGGPWLTVGVYEAQCLPGPSAGILSQAEDRPA